LPRKGQFLFSARHQGGRKVAPLQDRLAGFENQMVELRVDMRPITWMMGFVLPMLIAIPGLLLRVLPAIH
jgi:hypothetical protein